MFVSSSNLIIVGIIIFVPGITTGTVCANGN